ncbi:MAG: hypothetical protein R6V02_09920 [Candidatus Aminicenantes bacterium]
MMKEKKDYNKKKINNRRKSYEKSNCGAQKLQAEIKGVKKEDMPVTAFKALPNEILEIQNGSDGYLNLDGF